MKIPRDKLMHAGAGAIVGIVSQVVAWSAVAPIPGVGTIVAYATGLAKERWDEKQNEKALAKGEAPPRSVEVADVNSTAGGGLVIDLLTLVGGLTGVLPTIW